MPQEFETKGALIIRSQITKGVEGDSPYGKTNIQVIRPGEMFVDPYTIGRIQHNNIVVPEADQGVNIHHLAIDSDFDDLLKASDPKQVREAVVASGEPVRVVQGEEIHEEVHTIPVTLQRNQVDQVTAIVPLTRVRRQGPGPDWSSLLTSPLPDRGMRRLLIAAITAEVKPE